MARLAENEGDLSKFVVLHTETVRKAGGKVTVTTSFVEYRISWGATISRYSSSNTKRDYWPVSASLPTQRRSSFI